MEPKQKILIVDDSEINRAMLKEILGEGYEYLEAENGLRAIEILRRRTDIALVLLDLIMPEMDGFDVLRGRRPCCRHRPRLLRRHSRQSWNIRPAAVSPFP